MTPDLEIRVVTEDNSRLAYILRYAEVHGKDFDRRIEGPKLQISPRTYQLKVLRRLERLGNQLGTHNQRLSRAEVEMELAAIGHDLYKELFPPEMRREYSLLRKTVRSLLIVSEEPWIPWEVIKPYDEHYDDDFLCCQFELTRWLAKGGSLLTEIQGTRIAAVEADAPESSRKLLHSGKEIESLQQLAERHTGVDFQAIRDATYPETMKLLQRGGNAVLLFAGHGEFDADDPEESRFLLNDGRVLRPRDLHGSLETTIRKDRPLVFFNSCQVAQQDFSLTRVGGWAARWICECGCGAFLGPQWSVDDSLASLFSQIFFAALSDGATFGQAARLARLGLREQAPSHPAWLAYTAYAHPNGKLRLGDHSSTPNDEPPALSKIQISRPSGFEPSTRRRHPTLFRSAVLGILLVLLASILFWRFSTGKEIRITPPPPEDPGTSRFQTETEPIDIYRLQKPPYSPRTVSLYVELPQDIDHSTWRGRIELTADRELGAVGLERIDSTSAAWLVALQISRPTLSDGATGRICEIQASYNVYFQRQRKAGESTRARASKSMDDAACETAVHNVAERAARSVVTAFLDKTTTEN